MTVMKHKSDWRKSLNQHRHGRNATRTFSENSTNSLVMSTHSANGMDNNMYAQESPDKSLDSNFSSSAVRVDIADLSLSHSTGNFGTTHSLRKCKTQIFTPYSRLLQFIGWRGFGRDSIHGNHCCFKVLNLSYAFLILVLVLYTYIYDIFTCQWKLDVIKDTQWTTTTLPTTTMTQNFTNHTTISIPYIPIDTKAKLILPRADGNETELCEHIVTTYIVPDLLHLAAYLLGILYFRIRDNEHLYSVMEKVFLQTANVRTRHVSQARLVTQLRSFFIVGAVWVILTIILQAIFVYSFGLERNDLLSGTPIIANSDFKLVWLWSLFGLDLVGVAVANCINIAVVLNYVTQCALLRYYICAIGIRLKERSLPLRDCMKDVLNVRESISALNSSIARMTSLAVIRFAELTVIGLCILILNKDDSWRVWIYRCMFPLIWAAVLIFPLQQAASLNAACAKFKTNALHIRVFGYLNSQVEELDSFLVFIANITLRAKLFHIPVKPSYLLGVLILTCFVLLLLFQTRIVGPAGELF